ncbi:MAG: succinate dehydrogenase, hydrophobic membrane anchor protein [Chloroflexi bacterium]|nr:succinate dehydrogenase, hydrophobic membrane anchor protein [Chloroflexota bacterium]
MSASAERIARARATGNSFEVLSWFFMRLSGVILMFIVLFHLFYMHFVIGVDKINYALVVQRWENPLWRVFDLFLLFFALTHGLNGARYVIDDYVHGSGLNLLVKSIVYTLGFALLLMGTFIIFTFRITS